MPTYFLGIDSGLTVTKAVLFDDWGRAIAVGRREVERLLPRERFVERDMAAHWQQTAGAIRDAIAAAGIARSTIGAVGVAGHGDGIYLLDAAGAPLGHAILSLDSRGAETVDRWARDGVLDRAIEVTGQQPYPAAPSALLKWIKDHEPERYRRIGWVVSCKDWLRLNLTGRVATDLTDSSTSFVDFRTQDYSPAALGLFDLAELAGKLPRVLGSCEVAGTVTSSAAAVTGLAVGTPVVAGLHDVTASAVGSGVVAPDRLSIVAGTFSINQVLSAEAHPGRDWFCRNGFERGLWMNMSISPASSANIDWFLEQYCRDALEKAQASGASPFKYLEAEIADAFSSDSVVVYHPFLYGSPHGGDASAAFLGLQGWHHRGHLLRALFEGVVFNHRHHVEALRGKFAISSARLTGGSSRSPRICQLFADGLGLDVEVTAADETGALGAALCAAVGAGAFASLAEASDRTVSVSAAYSPAANVRLDMDQRYARYRHSVRQLAPEWKSLRAG